LFNRTLFISILAFTAWANAALAQDEEPGVAVLDTGTSAPVNVVGGFNFLDGSTNTSDQSENGHGTTVSQIINQEAPDIPQFQFVVNSSSISATDAALLRAASNPDIRVIAYTSAVIDAPSSSLSDASAAGKFVAVRTGNDARDNPAVAAVAASGLPGVAIVTGTNGAGSLLPSSNACGVTAERCVGVRGTTEFNDIFGTSFAAARLAGIAAEVLRNAPFLEAEELAQVIFATAEDTGDPRLGNGFVGSAEQVINNPAGPTSIGGGGGGAGAAALALGAAAGAAVLLSKDDELEKTLVLDSFGRPFYVDLTEIARVEDDRRSISGFFAALEQRHESTRLQIGEHHTLDAAYITSDLDVVDPAKYFAFEDDPAFNDRDYNWVLSLQGKYPNGFHYQVDRNRDPAMNFGVLDNVYEGSASGRSRFLSGQSFSVPVLSFGQTADSIGFGFGDDSGFGLDFGLVNTHENREHGRESVAAVVEGSYSFGERAEISLQFGHLQEDGSLFGGASNGAFSVDETDTLAASISGSLLIGDNTHLIGNYGVARSEVDDAESGLLSNFSSLRSNWFGVGMVSDKLFSKGDQFGLAFSRPLKVTAGEVDLRVPYARDFEGNIYNNVDRVSLVPEGNEYTLESYYLYQLDQDSSLGAYVMLRHDPNHFQNSGSDVTVLASYRARL
jgi:hypothetical protein